MVVRRHIDPYEDAPEPVEGEIVPVDDTPQAPMQEHEQASKEVATITDPKLLERFAEMAIAIPASDGNGAEDIMRQILMAESWEELNRPWDVSAVAELTGKKLVLNSATRRPSTFRGGLGMMLVLKLTDPKTGKEYVRPTSAASIIGQVAWLYFRNSLPALVEWVVAERPTQDGYYPQHLTIHHVMAQTVTRAEQVPAP